MSNEERKEKKTHRKVHIEIDSISVDITPKWIKYANWSEKIDKFLAALVSI